VNTPHCHIEIAGGDDVKPAGIVCDRDNAHLADTINLIEEIAGTRLRPAPARAAISPVSPAVFRNVRSTWTISRVGWWRDRSMLLCLVKGLKCHFLASFWVMERML